MSADTLNHAADEAKAAKGDARNFADDSQRAFTDALSAAERTIADAAKTAEKVLREGVEALRGQTKIYSESAGQSVGEAQRYVMERVKERPMTATLAGLGVGVLLGLLLSNRNK